MSPGRHNCKCVISEHMLQIKCLKTSHEIVLSWKPENTSDDESKLVQVMAWCHQATNQYLSQCWPRAMSPSLCRSELRASLCHNELKSFPYIVDILCNYSTNKCTKLMWSKDIQCTWYIFLWRINVTLYRLARMNVPLSMLALLYPPTLHSWLYAIFPFVFKLTS